MIPCTIVVIVTQQWPLSYSILHKQVLKAIMIQSMDTNEHFCVDNKLKQIKGVWFRDIHS